MGRRTRFATALVTAAVGAAVLAGCGDDGPVVEVTPSPVSPTATPEPATPVPTPGATVPGAPGDEASEPGSSPTTLVPVPREEDEFKTVPPQD
jgi:hypothetical protein